MAVGNRLIRVSLTAFLFLFTISTLRIPSPFHLVNIELELPSTLLTVKHPEPTTTTKFITATTPTTIISPSSASSWTNQTHLLFILSPSIVASEEEQQSPNVSNNINNNNHNKLNFNKSSALDYLRSMLPVAYHLKLLPSIQAAVETMWTCRHSSSNNDQNDGKNFDKLGFVHVFKTAGSTMRSFFHSYAQQCRGQSYATLTTCTHVEYQRLRSAHWKPCLLKDATKLGKYRVWDRHPVPAKELHRYDILGGHYRLGLLDYLPSTSLASGRSSKNQKALKLPPNPKVRTVIFFRNAAIKYVSGKVYIQNQNIKNYNQNPKNKKKKKQLQVSQVLQAIQQEMKHAQHSRLYHSKYATYLLTPEQYQQSQNWTLAYQVQVMKQNLIDYNVTIGMVEDMPRSMELIQQLIDPRHEVDHIFRRYRGDGSTSSQSSSRNISPLSSTSILETFQTKDVKTYERILEYVKWEQEITDFAMALQEVQYQTMGELYGNTKT